MKRTLLSLLLLLASAFSLSAISYREAREYAYFLTDKMAYELELTPEQYDRVYEVNLDYLLAINHRRDILSEYWDFRNMDLRYLLADWQYARFCTADYFYRPLTWRYGAFVFGIYDRYRLRDYYYYDRPSVYLHYRGTHWAQRRRHSPSPYSDFVVNGRYGGPSDTYIAPRGYARERGDDYRYDASPRYQNFSSGYVIEHGRRGDVESGRHGSPHGQYDSAPRGSNRPSTSFERYRSGQQHGLRNGSGPSRSTPPIVPSRNLEPRSSQSATPSPSVSQPSGTPSRSGVVSGRR